MNSKFSLLNKCNLCFFGFEIHLKLVLCTKEGKSLQKTLLNWIIKYSYLGNYFEQKQTFFNGKPLAFPFMMMHNFYGIVSPGL